MKTAVSTLPRRFALASLIPGAVGLLLSGCDPLWYCQPPYCVVDPPCAMSPCEPSCVPECRGDAGSATEACAVAVSACRAWAYPDASADSGVVVVIDSGVDGGAGTAPDVGTDAGAP